MKIFVMIKKNMKKKAKNGNKSGGKKLIII